MWTGPPRAGVLHCAFLPLRLPRKQIAHWDFNLRSALRGLYCIFFYLFDSTLVPAFFNLPVLKLFFLSFVWQKICTYLTVNNAFWACCSHVNVCTLFNFLLCTYVFIESIQHKISPTKGATVTSLQGLWYRPFWGPLDYKVVDVAISGPHHSAPLMPTYFRATSF